MNGIVTVQLDRPSKTGFLVWLVALRRYRFGGRLGARRRQPAGLASPGRDLVAICRSARCSCHQTWAALLALTRC